MSRTAILATLFLLALGGCANVIPAYDLPRDPRGAPTARTIVQRITCELAQMLTRSQAKRDILLANDIEVALQLSLTVNDAGALAPSLTYVNGPFSFNVGATVGRSREQNYFEKLYYSMRDLDQERISASADNFDLRKCPETDTNLAGNLGLEEAFDLAMTTSAHLNWKSALSGTDGAFGGYVNFVVTKNLNAVGPTWVLTHFRGPGNLGSISEINTDKIVFAFARGSQAGSPYLIANRRTSVPKSSASKADRLLEQININQLSTQLTGIRDALR